MALWVTKSGKTITNYSGGVGWNNLVHWDTADPASILWRLNQDWYSAVGIYNNYLWGNPDVSLTPNTIRLESKMALGFVRTPFRMPELDRDFMDDAGSGLEGATIEMKAPTLMKEEKGFFWGWDTDKPAGYVQLVSFFVPSEGKTWIKANWTGSQSNTASVTLALIGIREINDAAVARILYVSNSGTSATQDTPVNIDAQGFVEAYLDNRANYMAFEWIVLPPINVDLVGNEDIADDLADLHDAWLDISGGVSYSEYGGVKYAFGNVTWDDYYWSDPTIYEMEIRYTGDFTLPSRARLVPQGTIPRQD